MIWMLQKALQVGGEAAIVLMFRSCAATPQREARIPLKGEDTIVYEMAFRFGRADIVVFHIDGSASVIEVKDGTRGYNHVVAGIGQAGLYASQLAGRRAGLTKIRRCLLWTSTGNLVADAEIEDVCIAANVIPLPWGRLQTHLDATRDVLADPEMALEKWAP